MDIHDDDDNHNEDAGLNDEELSPNDGGAAKFAPVEVTSGEENFIPVHVVSAKLLRFDEGENQWKERGQGDAKILQFKDKPNRHLFIMRRAQIGKLAAQHELVAGIELKPHPSSDKCFIWSALADYSDEDDEGHPETFCIRFSTKELADEFKKQFDAVTKAKVGK